MRCWHWKLIPYLPKSQLLAQWRELNSIFKKQDKHILINYVYEYPEEDLKIYAFLVVGEMLDRGYKVKNADNYNIDRFRVPFRCHHTQRYLKQCFYNLQEKFDRGQKDFTIEQMWKLEEFVKRECRL